VIQAAAPDGVSGKVNVTAPALGIAGNLKGLSAAARACRLGQGPLQTGRSQLPDAYGARRIETDGRRCHPPGESCCRSIASRPIDGGIGIFIRVRAEQFRVSVRKLNYRCNITGGG
jgi:hypothetical protein